MINLTKKFYRDHWLGILLITIGLLLYQWMLTSIFPTIQKVNIEELVKQYPKEILAFFGGTELGFTSLEGYFNTEYLSLMFIIIVVGFIITLVTSEFTKEIEQGTIESVLSLPVTRTALISYKFVNITILTAYFSFVGIIPFTWMAIAYDFDFSMKAFYMVTLLTFLFFTSIASLTTALSVFFNERSKPIFIVIFILAYGYILNSLSEIYDKIKDYRFLSIFYYYDTVKALGDKEIALRSWLVICAIIVLSTAFAFYWFSHRDFAT